MERTQRILNQFPSFYKTWDRASLLCQIVGALGKRVDEAENNLRAILWAHWVDKAIGTDIGRLGALYNIHRKLGEPDLVYQSRLRRAIIEFKGGGTKSAILSALEITFGLPRDVPVELTENPKRVVSKAIEVRTGETWLLASESIFNVIPSIVMSLVEGTVTNPTLSNLDTGETITFNGILQSGDQLRIEDGKGILNGEDVTPKLSTSQIPAILRQGSTWRYSERLEKEVGIFDTTRFDQSTFPISIPTLKLTLKWVAHQPATFEIRLPKDALSLRDSATVAQEVVDSIKAAGVKGIVTFV